MFQQEVQQSTAISQSLGDVLSWSVADKIGLAGFVLALLLAGSRLYEWWLNKTSVRAEVKRRPRWCKRGDKVESQMQYQLELHHCRGRSFRIDRAVLTIRCRTPTESERRGFIERQRREPSTFKPIAMRIAVERLHLLEAGDSVFLNHNFDDQVQPWELVDCDSRFAILELYCQGRVIQRWDASLSLGDVAKYLVHVRHGNHLTMGKVDDPTPDECGELSSRSAVCLPRISRWRHWLNRVSSKLSRA